MENKKTVVSINLGNFGSTGHIAQNVLKEAQENGYCVFNAFPRDKKERPFEKNDLIISSDIFKRISQRICRYTGFIGCGAYFSTKRFLHRLKKIRPQILHLHNLHNSYINLPLLFRYIKKNKIHVVWTLHDCWSFTGQCPHFTFVKCDHWREGCGDCVQYKNYPEAAYDNTKKMFKLKKKWFTGVENMTVVTPSDWLANLARESFLNVYPIKVINNGIDLDVFKPTESDFREKNNISKEKFCILGVASGWGVKKGLDVFEALYEKLDANRFQIVLVGVGEEIRRTLPSGIITVLRTNNQKELAQIYTSADLFVNPTREDTYPTVNMESIACGTPVLTFDTGGSPEIVNDQSGVVVPCDDIDGMYNEIIKISKDKKISVEDCLQRAKDFDKKIKFKEYVELFDSISSGEGESI